MYLHIKYKNVTIQATHISNHYEWTAQGGNNY